jgi:UDP-glucose 4-epimerase
MAIYLITGATGFVGSAVLKALIANKLPVVAAVREIPIEWSREHPVVEVGNLGLDTDWSVALRSVSTIIHTVGRAHVVDITDPNSISKFRTINVASTLNLARQAAAAGVSRFIYISSVKVNGEESKAGHPFTEEDEPKPSDPYGISKLEAEKGLRLIADDTGMEVIIIRPVLVYGPGVKGNFLSMIHWLGKSIPLPLGGINNSRSLLALGNLVDFILICLHHPAAANETFLVSDGEDLSTSELLKLTASAMGIKPRLIPASEFMIKFFGALMGKREISRRLCGNLQVDISKARRLLGWYPPLSVEEGLAQLANSYSKS